MHSKPVRVEPIFEQIEYPCLMRFIGGDGTESCVVLATDVRSGMVVDARTDSFEQIGVFKDDWLEFDDKHSWEVLPSTEGIVLSN